MDAERIRRIVEHFERLYREGIKPWEEHGLEPHVSFFAGLLLAEAPAPRLLDLGCGSGWVSIVFARAGIRVTGIDSSPTAIAEAWERAREQGVEENVEFQEGDALGFPYPDGAFDAVFDRGFFHHVPESESPRYLSGVTRVLKPRGLFSLSAFSENNPPDIGRRFERADIERIFGTHFDVEHFEVDPIPNDAPAHLNHVIFRKKSP